jgi:hypothetical protein
MVVNLRRQSKHWPKGSVRMETLPEFSMQLVKGDRMISFDIRAGYRHFRLAPSIRDWFDFGARGATIGVSRCRLAAGAPPCGLHN